MTEPDTLHESPSTTSLLRDRNLRVVFSITLMAMLGVASITPAFPAVARALDVSPQSVGLLISAFTVPGVVLTPFLGVLADRIGRKAILVPSLLLFGLAGSACGLARSFDTLVALRFLQGMGGAALGALNITLIGDLFEGSRRTAAMGYNSAVLSVGTALYPAIGGALAMLAWFAPFFLPIASLPVAVFAVLTLRNPEPTPQSDLRTYLRNALRGMREERVVVMFVAGVVTFVLIYGAFLSFLPFVLEGAFGATPLGIGLVFAVASVATGIASFFLERLARLRGADTLVLTGFILYIVTMVLMPLAPSLWMLLVVVAGFGAANGITIPSILTIVAGSAPDEHRAIFMSVNGTLLRLGQTLGPLLAGTAFALLGLRWAFWIGAVLAAGLLTALVRVIRGSPGA